MQQAFLLVVVLLTAPLWLVALLAIVVGRSVQVVGLYMLVWLWWIGRARRRVLFVYSDSPHWKEYVESNIVPKLPPNTRGVELVQPRTMAEVQSAGSVVQVFRR